MHAAGTTGYPGNRAQKTRQGLVLCFSRPVKAAASSFSSSNSTGRQVLEQKEEEQRGRQALPRRAQVEGEPDHRQSGVPGARERGAAKRSGRAAEGLRPLQEHGSPLRSQIWTTVREHEKHMHNSHWTRL